MPIDPRLSALIVCPACRSDLRERSHDDGLECVACKRVYPVQDGMPILLVDEAAGGRATESPE